ncbi:MAG: diaminopimelate epimerase [Candidatus Krumholzibacteria bacterium]|nr:diaminopimelate epimerase [Candidatus Krumholzibacteria bacterium]
MEFYKMHGAGNDFVMIEDMSSELDFSTRLIESLCADHTGIGADGLIILRPSAKYDFRMRYFNKDGGEAEMCGNGARCAASFAFLKGIVSEKMVFDTKAGPVEAMMHGEDVRIGVGSVKDMRLHVPVGDAGLEVGYAVCGVPHAVLLTEDVDSWSRERFVETGRKIRNAAEFSPGGVNFNLVSVMKNDILRYRTYERGVEAETLACGTGAIALAAICSAMGITGSPLKCRTTSGDTLEVDFSPAEDGARDCFLKGPAIMSFQGVFETHIYI